jgi:hypothetical protein
MDLKVVEVAGYFYDQLDSARLLTSSNTAPFFVPFRN